MAAPMTGFAMLLYGATSYAAALATVLYAAGFVGNLMVPKSIDSGNPYSMADAFPVNAALLGLFALQHSVMARPGFKAVWTRIVPEAVERSTYVLLSSGVLLLLFWQWRPVPEPVWQVEHGAGVLLLSALSWMGWAIVVLSAAMMGHLDLFGLRQAYLRFKRREPPADRFRTPGFYRFVRHPLMLGLLIAFWATPVMSVGHLMFAAVSTVYILLVLPLEERDLAVRLGGDYRRYRERVPMLVPIGISKNQE
jgi:protein-S-isoprenylcysteine O-methyltransferase Ste14